MKASIFLSLVFTTAVHATGVAQRVTISVNNAKLEQVFNEISRQTSYNFLCSDDIIKESKLHSLNMKNLELSEALHVLLKRENLDFKLIDNTILINKAKLMVGDRSVNNLVSVQQVRLQGKVNDEDGIPLPGVFVNVKGGTAGTTTDANGNYTLSLPNTNITLVISYMGFEKQEVAVAGRSTVNIVLKSEARNLSEVIVVGYGTQRKETLTGAVTAIKADEITTTKTENLINNIQGKMPGVLIRQQTGEPGVFDNMVSIRGYGAPLVVIDGIVRDGTSDLAQLNPDDVESISVLKDASAAIYGMNAANGVIIVTTKKGLSGKAKFSYSNLLGAKGATGMERTVDAYTYRLMANEMQRNIGAAPTYSDEILEKYKNNEPGYIDNDWIKMFMYDQVFQQQHSISVRGGSDKVKYFNSFSYTEDNGLLRSDIQNYRRYNFRSTTTSELTKDLTLNISLSGRFDKTQLPREDFLWTYKTLMVNDRGIGYHTMADPNHLSAIDPENKNAYALVNPDIDGYRRRRNTQYQSTAELTYKAPFAKGLTFTAIAAFDGLQANNSQLQKSYKLYNYFTDAYVSTFGLNSYSNNTFLYQRTHARGQVNYARSWENKHNLTLTAVTEMTATRTDNLQGSRQYVDVFTHDILDQGTATTAANGGNRSQTRLAAYLGKINYDYKGKYLLEGVGRYDGSYRYAVSKRWTFFPSVSAGWRISEESFFKEKTPFITNLKLRASYGEIGRDAGFPFEYIAGYTANSSRGYVFSNEALTPGMVPPGIVNNNLSWVTSKSSNIGLDFDFWNGKLSGAVDIFQRKNSGELATRVQSVPNTFGASFPQENLNSNMERGVELLISHRGKVGEDFTYGVSTNFTYARRKQLHVERAPFTSSWDRWKNSSENRYDGRMWLYEYSGQYTSLDQYETAPLMGGAQGNSKMLPGSYRIIDRNGDGIIDANDQTPNHWTFGAVNPPIQFGLTLSAAYKQFDLNILLQGASGYSINYRNNDIWGYGRYPTLHEKFLDRWHPANIADDPYNPATQWISGYYPAIRSNTANTTDQYLIDVWRPGATYLRLKSLEIGYKLPQKVIKKLGLENVRVFANGFNLLTFTRRELRNADPERQEKDWDANLTYPLMKSYNFGLNVNF